MKDFGIPMKTSDPMMYQKTIRKTMEDAIAENPELKHFRNMFNNFVGYYGCACAPTVDAGILLIRLSEALDDGLLVWED